MQRAFVLVVTAAGEAPHLIELDATGVTIGSSRHATFRVSDASLAQHHARIHRAGPRVELEDLARRGDILVNGRPFTESATLECGDTISIGKVEVVIALLGGRRGRVLEAPGLTECGTQSGEQRVDLPPASSAFRIDQISVDPATSRMYAAIRRMASSDHAILLVGEPGVGAEHIAEVIHHSSERRDMRLARINCAEVPGHLLETELFGRGASASGDHRAGLFEFANGGTLFIDEIADMPTAVQAKLLRVIERTARGRSGARPRIGTAPELAMDVRVVVATSGDLDAETRAGRFRQDLGAMLGGFTITIPPLRARPNEIVLLAERLLDVAARERGRRPPTIASEVRDSLVAYSWPGNLRELTDVLERALVSCGAELTLADLPERLHGGFVAGASTVRRHLVEVERAAILAALEAAHGNQTRAARTLGMSRRAIIYKMEKFGLKAPPSIPRGKRTRGS